MPENSRVRWYVLQVRPKHESIVASRLEGWGIETFLPKHKLQSSRCPSTSSIQALFPGYVFCHLQLPTNPKLYQMPGVIRLLGPARHPTPIEDEEIASLRVVVDTLLPIEMQSYLEQKPGCSVRIIDGPLAGISGVLFEINSGCKLSISFPTMQSSVAVFLPTEWIHQAQIQMIDGSRHSPDNPQAHVMKAQPLPGPDADK